MKINKRLIQKSTQHTLSRQAPPGCLEGVRLLNSPLSTHPFETTGGAYLERVCPSLLPPRSHPIPTPFPPHLHSREAAHSVCCDVILGAIQAFRVTDSPGSVIISDASNMRGQRSKVTELWLKCSFGAIYGATNVV